MLSILLQVNVTVQWLSKIELACEMIGQVPSSGHPTYVLMDSWYPSALVL
ncbi:hypothetical protein [Paenibacillus sp. NRS-1781]